jgi:hypothetical protein
MAYVTNATWPPLHAQQLRDVGTQVHTKKTAAAKDNKAAKNENAAKSKTPAKAADDKVNVVCFRCAMCVSAMVKTDGMLWLVVKTCARSHDS